MLHYKVLTPPNITPNIVDKNSTPFGPEEAQIEWKTEVDDGSRGGDLGTKTGEKLAQNGGCLAEILAENEPNISMGGP